VPGNLKRLRREILELKFHWRLLQGGEQSALTRHAGVSYGTGMPDLEAQSRFCHEAEEAGIHGLLTDFSASRPDPIILATALGLACRKVQFIVAYRSGLMSPTTFVQQINTVAAVLDGRLSLNIVVGHSPEEQAYYGDLLPRPERYARTNEFLEVCLALWQQNGPVTYRGNYYALQNACLKTPFASPERASPEIFIAGGSPEAQDLAIQRGTTWMRMGDTPENVREGALRVLASGKQVGLRMAIIARPTREEAVAAAHHLVETLDPSLGARQNEEEFVRRSDSVSIKNTYELAGKTEWPKPYLWMGAVRTHGPATVCLVGSPQELADAFMEYKRIGISQFILSGWPKLEEMVYFGREVLPLVRRREREIP
jgi:alkanesulfonate monooxygenase